MYKAIILSTVLLVSGCKANQTTTPATESKNETATVNSKTDFPSIRKQLQCLPKSAAFVAAHRGTSKKANLAENSGSSLKKLINKGILFAEIDVAGLSDGTHILFHDGVWDEKSTGKGAVSSTSWSEAQKFLLKQTDGDFSGDRPIKLADVLAMAKDRMYLEIDFKSSAKYEKVIKLIREQDMADQVILISYSKGQARKLARLAPEMYLSVSASSIAEIAQLEKSGVTKSNMAVWMGKGPFEPTFITYLNNAKIPVLAWPKEGARKSAFGPATVAVTDYALQKKPIEGLRRSDRAAYEACLTD